jgi:hypothetical protein
MSSGDEKPAFCLKQGEPGEGALVDLDTSITRNSLSRLRKR